MGPNKLKFANIMNYLVSPQNDPVYMQTKYIEDINTYLDRPD